MTSTVSGAVAEEHNRTADRAIASDIARRRTRPAMTVHEILDRLAAVLPTFVSRVRAAPSGTA